MPTLTPDEQLAAGLIPPPPGEREVDPKTKITRLATLDHGVYRRRLTLKEDDLKMVKQLLSDCYEEWKSNTGQLNSKLRKYNNRLEGISSPKDYPWPGACSLTIPMTEIHILSLHALIVATMLDNDPIWFAKELLPAGVDDSAERVDPDIEWFLNFVAKVQLDLDKKLSEAFYNALQHPLAIGVLDWVEDIGREYHVEVFNSVQEFQDRFSSAEEAGISEGTYMNFLTRLVGGEEVQVKVEEDVARYRGPDLRIVEVKDLVRAPVTAPTLEYTIFHGDQFRQRANWFRVMANRGWFDKSEVEAMLKDPGETSAIDTISEQQNRIEGIASTRKKSDEYDGVRGNLRVDLNKDGEEELYHVVFNPKTKSLLRIEDYPYWHNRINYIPFKIRRRTNRLLGRCITDMLWDTNEEVDTQHQMRIDSRAITTVPSFKKLQSETDLDLSRKDQHFYPGVTFTLNKIDGFQQLEIKQTDMGSSLQEEQNLFQIAEWLVGNSPSLRSGTPQTKDPRASGKKAQAQIQQSNIRVDDYIKELMGPTNEIGSQVLELYYQFSPKSVIPYARYDESTGNWVRKEIQRAKLRNRNMHIKVARTSILDNPDQIMQRALVNYQIWSKEPMIGGNPVRRHELIRRALFAEREKDISKLLPPLQVILQEMQQAQAQAMADPAMAQLHGTIQNKVGKAPDKEDRKNGMRQGGPDVSTPTLGKK